jgi:chromosome segregation ATPase
MALKDECLKQRPDDYTLAWFQERFQEVIKGYRGATHAVNRSLADYEDCLQAVKALQSRCDTLESQRDADRARIGELQAELLATTDKTDKMAEWIKTNCTQCKREHATKPRDPNS